MSVWKVEGGDLFVESTPYIRRKRERHDSVRLNCLRLSPDSCLAA